jgi:outer membrane murein-binding lipoprotein Lpp
MRKDTQMESRIAGFLVIAVFLFAGCQQQQTMTEAPNERQARLLAAQSADLQRQLAARQSEIETLRHKHAEELGRRDEELAKCKAQIQRLQEDLEKGIDERVRGVTTTLMEENARLREEIERLKAETAEPPQTPQNDEGS